MKKLGILALMLIFILIISPVIDARKGVGIVWSTETEVVDEGSKHCVTYGVYNPWDEDVRASLDIGGSLNEVITKKESEIRLIEAKIYHDKAIPIELCVKIPKVYEEDCLIGSFLCEQTCQEDEIAYKGDIVVNQEPEDMSGSGSAVALGVSAPLNIRVRCNQHPRDWTLVYIILILIILIIITTVLYRRYRTPPIIRQKERLRKIESKIKRMEKNK